MNSSIVNEILMGIFLDYFYISNSIFVLLTSFLVFCHFYKIKLLSILMLVIWYIIVSVGAFVFIFLIIDFFSQGKGLGRLASIPLILGASPLFLCFFILIFIYPKRM